MAKGNHGKSHHFFSRSIIYKKDTRLGSLEGGTSPGGVLIDTVNVSMTQKLMEAIHPQNMNVALVTNNLVEGPEQKHEKQLS